MRILESMASDDFEEVIYLQDRRSGLRCILAIHSTARGPAFGGVRRWGYSSEAQALRDVLRLARSMTFKCAMAGVAGGGGKIVLLDHGELDVEAACVLLGQTVENLGGRFFMGPDLGTGSEMLELLSRHTRFVTRPGPEGPGDLAGATAEGVFHGIQAALEHVFGVPQISGRHFAIQGLGAVGGRLARMLVAEGGKLSIADIDEEKADSLGTELRAQVISPGRIFDVECDVFCPCAMGGVLHDLSINRLRARIVAGSANTVLATPQHGEQLFQRGIAYAPDYVINAGALIQAANLHLHGTRDNKVAIARIGAEIAWILAESRRLGLPPHEVADREAHRRVTSARGKKELHYPQRWDSEHPFSGSGG